ncbi:unnamed protein product [Tuber melanosporum]|uniref:(Perigord truffle) hypothetical protein n=1 Tax=Tuber melanosporum (strain Mel28) TaxID=656061 RepID=D5GPA8_TUBMM|nr:uncharacterized protein GSTUM_00011781001 [Tuber melanosporum]CAZ86373.1 unnamed protein product [Tuber melanosporum]
MVWLFCFLSYSYLILSRVSQQFSSSSSLPSTSFLY